MPNGRSRPAPARLSSVRIPAPACCRPVEPLACVRPRPCAARAVVQRQWARAGVRLRAHAEPATAPARPDPPVAERSARSTDPLRRRMPGPWRQARTGAAAAPSWCWFRNAAAGCPGKSVPTVGAPAAGAGQRAAAPHCERGRRHIVAGGVRSVGLRGTRKRETWRRMIAVSAHRGW